LLSGRDIDDGTPGLDAKTRGDHRGCTHAEIAQYQGRAFRVATDDDFLPERGVVVVGIDHHDAALRQCADQRSVLGGDVGDALHEFLVFALRVVDDADRRHRDRGKFRCFAGMVHADLDHGGAMLRAQTEHRQRQADGVVEISGCGQHLPFTDIGAQDRGGHFLHRGLAIAADDADDRQHEALAPERGERAERAQRIGDGDQVAG
jgi:hypothetical protein